MQNILMKFDPATGEERPYPSHAAQWREWHGGTAWLFDPWTGRRRDARDVGSDVHGLLIVPAGTLGMDMGDGCCKVGAGKTALEVHGTVFFKDNHQYRSQLRFPIADGAYELVKIETPDMTHPLFHVAGESFEVVPDSAGAAAMPPNVK